MKDLRSKKAKCKITMSVEGKTKNIENCLNVLEIIAQLHKGIEVEMELHVQELPQDENDQHN